ncbi:hypothetical protein [Sporosarcina highlanderae]|uniref:Flagellar hook-length control protein FliK n=1 Tax=Sporosarcina highlanderae TaxID=3035916 RepID=A0ABT8JQQ9_9BACL|nr:hypothetical protein [Sporosarcina highlanderae]MDN4607480.1 hypothetical protein [Sporosarcina highlanderae]
MSHPSIHGLMNNFLTPNSIGLSLREGQVFQGRINQIFKGQMAEVQIGEQKLMARLEVAMQTGDAYFFKVKSIEPDVQLKIITGPITATETKENQMMKLIETMQLPKSEEMQSLINHFIKHKIPVSRENLISAAHLMKSVPPTIQEEALSSVQRLVELKLPLTDLNFKTFVGIETKEGMHRVLDSFKTALVDDFSLSAHHKDKILGTLDQLGRISNSIVEQTIDGNVMKDVMQKLFNTLGFNYEAVLIQNEPDINKIKDMLKPQLIALLNESAISPALREASELAVARLNGSLLQSVESGMNQQIVMQLPLELLGKRIDATMQWNGRMREDGKIDPEYARILFYLDLSSIKETVIDMQVQNRVVSVTVFNDDEKLKLIGDIFQERLKSGLESADYKLSGISFKKLEKEAKRNISNQLKSNFQGVDFRV